MMIAVTHDVSLTEYKNRHEDTLKKIIKDLNLPSLKIQEAIHYCLFPGGKRLRPMLVYLCGEIVHANLLSLDIIAASIELTHSYSLVHDDLPAMDNDDVRRGKPSCHRAYDEATAILVGDALQALAIDILLTYLPNHLNANKVIHITHELIKAIGPAGMISGQSLDLTELQNPEINEEQLKQIHLLKTGKLIETCINMSATAGEYHSSDLKTLQQFAYNMGLAFQIQDDYLDHYCAQEIGKCQSSDSENQKITFANLYPKEKLRALINQFFNEAIEILKPLGHRAAKLIVFANSLKKC